MDNNELTIRLPNDSLISQLVLLRDVLVYCMVLDREVSDAKKKKSVYCICEKLINPKLPTKQSWLTSLSNL